MVPTPHFIRVIEEILLGFRVSNHVVAHSEDSFLGRKVAAKIVAKIMDMPYFEISEENLKEQMKLVLRMEKPVLFVLRQNHLSESRWGEMLRVAQARVMELKII